MTTAFVTVVRTDGTDPETLYVSVDVNPELDYRKRKNLLDLAFRVLQACSLVKWDAVSASFLISSLTSALTISRPDPGVMVIQTKSRVTEEASSPVRVYVVRWHF